MCRMIYTSKPFPPNARLRYFFCELYIDNKNGGKTKQECIKKPHLQK